MKNKKYSPEYKIKCVKEVLEDHKSQKEITRKYELKTDRTIRRWIRNYQEHGESYFDEEHRVNNPLSGSVVLLVTSFVFFFAFFLRLFNFFFEVLSILP